MQRATAEKKDLFNISTSVKESFILLSEKKRFMILSFSMAVED